MIKQGELVDLGKLGRVLNVVAHRNGPGSFCPDGLAAAILVKDAMPAAHIVLVNHEELEELPVSARTMFVDIAPPRSKLGAWVEADPIVLDHHEKQRDVVEQFAHGAYSDEPGVSGAVLAHRHVWEQLARPDPVNRRRSRDFAELAGIRDTWQKDSLQWDKACEQAQALRFYPDGHLLGIRDPFGMGFGDLDAALAVGPVLVRKERDQNEAMARRAVFLIGLDLVVAVVATLHTSDLADMIPNADVVVGFSYGADPVNPALRPRMTLSMRSKGSYDVGEVAKRLGGGGHRAAAGATIAMPDGNPYAAIKDIFAGG